MTFLTLHRLQGRAAQTPKKTKSGERNTNWREETAPILANVVLLCKYDKFSSQTQQERLVCEVSLCK